MSYVQNNRFIFIIISFLFSYGFLQNTYAQDTQETETSYESYFSSESNATETIHESDKTADTSFEVSTNEISGPEIEIGDFFYGNVFDIPRPSSEYSSGDSSNMEFITDSSSSLYSFSHRKKNSSIFPNTPPNSIEETSNEEGIDKKTTSEEIISKSHQTIKTTSESGSIPLSQTQIIYNDPISPTPEETTEEHTKSTANRPIGTPKCSLSASHGQYSNQNTTFSSLPTRPPSVLRKILTELKYYKILGKENNYLINALLEKNAALEQMLSKISFEEAQNIIKEIYAVTVDNHNTIKDIDSKIDHLFEEIKKQSEKTSEYRQKKQESQEIIKNIHTHNTVQTTDTLKLLREEHEKSTQTLQKELTEIKQQLTQQLTQHPQRSSRYPYLFPIALFSAGALSTYLFFWFYPPHAH